MFCFRIGFFFSPYHFTKHHVYWTLTSFYSVAILFYHSLISCQSIFLKSVCLFHTLISLSFTTSTQAFTHSYLTHSSLPHPPSRTPPYCIDITHSSTHRCVIYFTHSSTHRCLIYFSHSNNHPCFIPVLFTFHSSFFASPTLSLSLHPSMISPLYSQTVWRGGRACSVGGWNAMWAMDGRARGSLRRPPRRHPLLRPGRTRIIVSPSH